MAVNEALNKAQDKAEKAAQITERIRLRTEGCYINSMKIPARVLQIRESTPSSSACIIIKLPLIIDYLASPKSPLGRCSNRKILTRIFIASNRE